jgi:hypothetical protein
MAFLLPVLIAINSGLTKERERLERILSSNINASNSLNWEFNTNTIKNNNLSNYYNNKKKYLTDNNNRIKTELSNISKKYDLVNAAKKNNENILKTFEGFNTSDNPPPANSIIGKLFLDKLDSTQKLLIERGKLYTYLYYQNDIINKRYQNIKNQFTQNDSKYEKYTNTNIKLNTLNDIFFYLFYILLIVLSVCLYLYQPNMSNRFKIFIIILLLLFPFIIYTIEIFLYNATLFMYSILSGKVYNNLSYSNKVVLNNTTDLTNDDN